MSNTSAMLTSKYEETFICRLCNIKMNNQQELQHHTKTRHLGIYVCNVCRNFKTLIRKRMEGHRKRVHNLKTPKSEDLFEDDEQKPATLLSNKINDRVGCDYCFFVSDTQQELDAHFLEKHSDSTIMSVIKKFQSSGAPINVGSVTIALIEKPGTGGPAQVNPEQMMGNLAKQNVSPTHTRQTKRIAPKSDSKGNVEIIDLESPPKRNKSTKNENESNAKPILISSEVRNETSIDTHLRKEKLDSFSSSEQCNYGMQTESSIESAPNNLLEETSVSTPQFQPDGLMIPLGGRCHDSKLELTSLGESKDESLQTDVAKIGESETKEAEEDKQIEPHGDQDQAQVGKEKEKIIKDESEMEEEKKNNDESQMEEEKNNNDESQMEEEKNNNDESQMEEEKNNINESQMEGEKNNNGESQMEEEKNNINESQMEGEKNNNGESQMEEEKNNNGESQMEADKGQTKAHIKDVTNGENEI